MSIKLKTICFFASAIILTGCSSKTPMELINEYESQIADKQLNEAIADAEILSKTKNPEVQLITFYSEIVPPHFFELHRNNGLDVSGVEIGYPTRPNLPTLETKVDLPAEANRTIATMDPITSESFMTDRHNH